MARKVIIELSHNDATLQEKHNIQYVPIYEFNEILI